MNVIIMAQGQQTRLAGAIKLPKQWLPLGTREEPILARTLRQLGRLTGATVTVVATAELNDLMWTSPHPMNAPRAMNVITLETPGNNLLAGMREVFVKIGEHQEPAVVLLGDVVYSWATLRVLLRQVRPANLHDRYWPPVLFAGTRVVTAATGELWGMSWDADGLDMVLSSLSRIKDPPFGEYQCGQLRKLLWEIQKFEVLPVEAVPNPFVACAEGRWYHPTDDYTADIDTPRDLERLPYLGQQAAEDDDAEGREQIGAPG